MKRQLVSAAVSAVLVAAGVAASGTVTATDRSRIKNHVVARLAPSQEVPVVSAPGAKGTFKAVIDETNQTITYELSYEGLEGVVSQAHIHIGQRGANGGVSVFLCGNAPTVPPAAFPQPPACPASPATVTGVVTAAMIIGPAGQGIAPSSATANEFAELVDALRDGLTYANVHSSKFPGGEVRGQVRIGFLHDKDD
jgi:hypothetical protein